MGDIKNMTLEQLESRFEALSAADPADTDSDEVFTARMEEMGVIQAEIVRRQGGKSD